MSYDCDSAKVNLLEWLNAAQTDAEDAAAANYQAFLAWQVGNYPLAIGHLNDAVNQCIYALYYVIGKNTNYDPPFLQSYLWEECAGEVTWKSIAEAWVKKDFEGRTVTIAVIDRMRQLIWDEPFYVAWAARPEEQIE